MANLQVARSVLREYNLKLILIECAFRVTSNKFHGFMFTSRGIEANIKKLWLSLCLNMQKPKTICNLLSLNNKITTLIYSCPYLRRAPPLFKTLWGHLAKVDTSSKRRNPNIKSREEKARPFKELKVYIQTLPLLTWSAQDEDLYI